MVNEMKAIMLLSDRERNYTKLKFLMAATYTARRQLLNEGASFSEVLREYPALGTESLLSDFETLVKIEDINSVVRANINRKMLCVIDIALKKNGARNKIVRDLVEKIKSNLSEGDDAQRKAIGGMLPALLSEDSNLIFKECKVGKMYCNNFKGLSF